MSLSTTILLVTFLSILLGAKRPIIGAIGGTILFPILVYIFLTNEIKYVVISTLFGLLFGSVSAFVASIFFSGLKGKGHNSGPSYMGGFGGGRGGAPPGGIILSDEERKMNKK